MEIKKETKSLCPTCLKILDAKVYDNGDSIVIEKECSEHGKFTNTYWNDKISYDCIQEYASKPHKLSNPQMEAKGECPSNCGLCSEHESQTILGLIDVTNRCNLRCPVCFANAAASGTLYEPTYEQIRTMLQTLRKNQPVETPAIQFSGGEPTVREDLVELIKLAKEEGFTHTQIATNGLVLANDLQFVKYLKKAGLNTVYLQFDGVTEEVYLKTRNANILSKKLEAIENCRKANLGIVLVPTLLKGINSHQVGDIIQFAIDNIDVIRGVNFQPVSFAGRTPADQVEEQRITIKDLITLTSEQTNGAIKAEAFYPASSVAPISDLISALGDGTPEVTLTCHQNCGSATYVFKEDDKIIPITDFIDVDKFLKLAKKSASDMSKNSRIATSKAIVRATKDLPRAISSKKSPSYLDITTILKNIFIKQDYESLGEFHVNALLISAMHFMDPFNFDQDRVRRCVIHYATPDGRIIPFCSMNNIYREDIEKEFNVPLDSVKDNKIKENISKTVEDIKKEYEN